MSDEALPPSGLAIKIERFWKWNGYSPAPQLTHWTPSGTIIIRAATAFTTTEILWRPKGDAERRLGFGGPRPETVCGLIARGEYDGDAGFPISEISPAEIEDWNDLG